MQQQYEIAKIESILEERERSWIMILLYNRKIKNLYMLKSKMLSDLLLKFYSKPILNLASMCLDSLNSEDFKGILCRELERCCGVKKLDLSNNNLGSLARDSFQALLCAITKCPNLEVINVSKNNFNTEQKSALDATIEKKIRLVDEPELSGGSCLKPY